MTRFKFFGQASSVLLAATILVVGTSPAMAKEKIAVVDIKKVFQKSSAGKDFQSHMKDFMERKRAIAENENAKFEKEGKELQSEHVQIAQERGVLPPKAFKKKELEWQGKAEDFNKRRKDFQQRIQTEINSEAMVGFHNFMKKINDATQFLGKKYGFTLIISRNPIPLPPLTFAVHSPRILFISSDADITQSVIKYVNEHASQ